MSNTLKNKRSYNPGFNVKKKTQLPYNPGFGKALFFDKRDVNTVGGEVDPNFELSVGQSRERLVPKFDYPAAVTMYKTSPILFGCANVNAKTVASLPMKLFAFTNGRSEKEMKAKSPWRLKPLSPRVKSFFRGELYYKPSPQVMRKYIDRGGSFVEVDDPTHPILQLLGQGAADYRQSITNGTDQTVARITDLQICGNYYLQAIMSGGLPSELWVVPARNMVIEPFKSGPRLIKNYFWGENPNSRTQLDPAEIIHGKIPNLDDLYYGQSWCEPAWIALNWLRFLDEMQIAGFKNMNIPSIIASIPGAQRDTLTRFERAYNNKMRGTRNTGKLLAINGNDVQFITPSFSRGKDALTDGIPANYISKVTEIAFAFGVPISKILSLDTNLGTAYITSQDWMKDTISHLCHYDESTLNQFLLPLFGLENDVFLSYENILPKDDEKIETRLINLKKNGIISAATVREELGFDDSNAPEVPTQLDNSNNAVIEETDNDGEREPRGSSEEFENGDRDPDTGDN